MDVICAPMLYAPKFVDTWPLQAYVLLPQTAAAKLEAHIKWLCMLWHYIYLLLELKGPNLLQHENAPVHKASSIKTFPAKYGVKNLKKRNCQYSELKYNKRVRLSKVCKRCVCLRTFAHIHTNTHLLTPIHTYTHHTHLYALTHTIRHRTHLHTPIDTIHTPKHTALLLNTPYTHAHQWTPIHTTTHLHTLWYRLKLLKSTLLICMYMRKCINFFVSELQWHSSDRRRVLVTGRINKNHDFTHYLWTWHPAHITLSWPRLCIFIKLWLDLQHFSPLVIHGSPEEVNLDARLNY